MKLDTEAETSKLDLDGLKKQLITLIKIAPKYTLKLRNLEHALNKLKLTKKKQTYSVRVKKAKKTAINL